MEKESNGKGEKKGIRGVGGGGEGGGGDENC